jgi:hypothetical protein
MAGMEVGVESILAVLSRFSKKKGLIIKFITRIHELHEYHESRLQPIRGIRAVSGFVSGIDWS